MSKKESMFSRAGKASIDKFKIFHQRSEILSKEHKAIKPLRLELFKKKLSVVEINVLAAHENEKILQDKSEGAKKTPQLTSAFAAQSREEFYEKTNKKPDIPPPGWYNLSYTLIDKHSNSPSMRKYHRMSSPIKSGDFFPECLLQEPEPLKKDKVSGMVSFEKQLPRRRIFKEPECPVVFPEVSKSL